MSSTAGGPPWRRSWKSSPNIFRSPRACIWRSASRSRAALGFKKIDPKRAGFTVDTPVPYLLADLVNLIDERMGKLENRATRMHCHRLIARIETLKNDPRYGFMFENANVGGDTMAEILTNLFRLEPNGQPMTVMQLAGLPTRSR